MPTALPKAFRDHWRPIGTRTRRSRVALASATAETTLYEHRPTVDALDGRDLKPDERDIPSRSLFAIDLEISPPLTSMGISPQAVLGMAASHVIDQFVDSVEDDGLRVEDERETAKFERADGTTGKWYILSTVADVDPATVAVDGASIPAETHVGVWPTGGTYGVAGGTLPLSAPAGLEDALEVDPERDRKQVLEFARTVEPEDKSTSNGFSDP
ncbi:hypothetical protein ACYJ1Y_06555 [Natrialbaceae archaeon A-gly3]